MNNTELRGSLDDMDVRECEWVVNLDANDTGARRVVVKAVSEMGAILTAEEELGVTGISAYPKLQGPAAYHTPRCPICAGLNCKNPHDGRY